MYGKLYTNSNRQDERYGRHSTEFYSSQTHKTIHLHCDHYQDNNLIKKEVDSIITLYM